MTSQDTDTQTFFSLPTIPAGARVMLTVFLAIVGTGYLVALANIYHSHAMADGRAGLSLDDVRAVYSGLDLSRRANEEIPSRMLTMLRGAMRQYVSDDDDYTVLETWLKSGGAKADLNAGESRRTPERVIIRHCMRCHAQSAGEEISKRAPFGPDDLTVDHEMMSPLLTTVTTASVERHRAPPQYTVPRLVLVSHIHMLSIPMFTLVVGLLFAATRIPARWRTLLTPLPMIALAFDFAGWWLARLHDGFILLIIAGGGAFSLVFGAQIIAIVFDLWRPVRRIMKP